MKTVGNKQIEGYVELLGTNTGSFPAEVVDTGRLYKKVSDVALYWKPDGGAEVTIVGAGANAAPAVSFGVTQVSHGFTVGNAVYFSGTSFHKAIATETGSLAIGIASAIADGDNFTFTNAGQIYLSALQWSGVVGTSGLVAGTSYYLSDTTAGKYVTYSSGIISQKMFISEDLNYAILQMGGTAESTTATIPKQNISISNDNSGSITAAFGSQPAGKYELFEAVDPLLEATLFWNSSTGNLRVYSTDSRITTTPDTSNSLNIYASGNVYFQNKTGSAINLLVYQKTL